MITIQLFDFLQTGCWGPVTKGMSLSAVKGYLGKPNQEEIFGTGFTDILYGWNELFFDTETQELWAIQNDSLFPLYLEADGLTFFQNSHFSIQAGFLAEQPSWTREQVTLRLEQAGIPFQSSARRNYTVLQFASGAYLDFHSSEELGGPPTPMGEDKLIGFRYFPYLSERAGG